METLSTTGTAEKYIELFRQNKGLIINGDPDFMSDLREEAILSFEKSGFPKKRQEDYKYSHLEPVFDGELSFHFSPRDISFDNQELFRCDVPMLDSHVLTVLNGFFYNPEGPAIFELENGIVYGSLKEAIHRYPELVSRYLGQGALLESESFVSLNTAFSQDGIFLYVPKGKKLKKPIQIINLLLSDKNEMVHHRNLVILEENASAEVIICDHTLSPYLFLTNSVTEAFISRKCRPGFAQAPERT